MRGLFSRHNRYLASIGGLAIVAITLVALAYGVTESERLDIQNDDQTATTMRGLLMGLASALNDQESAISAYLLSGSADSLGSYQQAVASEAKKFADLRAAAAGRPEVEAAIAEVDAYSAKWHASFAQPAINAVQRQDEAALARAKAVVGNNGAELDTGIAPLARELDGLDAELRARSSTLALTHTIATGLGLAVMLIASGLALWLIRRYGRTLEREARHTGVLNQFTEVASFALDDTAVARSNLEALALLAHPDAAVTHVFNRSKDRAVPEATLGDALAEVLSLNALSGCPGMVRSTMYVTSDAAAPLSVHCPVYPVQSGTLACVPLSSGEMVGSVHLYWHRSNALALELRASVSRIAEHAALSIGNRRLLAALHGQANTDPRTGLANSRAFDLALEEALSARSTDESIAVLMLDIDHFKDFNDRHGHPAGDEALRAFARVLRSCMREMDVAARYGGEEFAVLLAGVDPETALTIAERVRTRTESTLIALAPGITDRISVSIGVACAPAQALERVTLLRIADEALYRAKQAGRNRVVYDGADEIGVPATANKRSRPERAVARVAKA